MMELQFSNGVPVEVEDDEDSVTLYAEEISIKIVPNEKLEDDDSTEGSDGD